MDGQDNLFIIIVGLRASAKAPLHMPSKTSPMWYFSADSRQVYKEMRIGTAVPPIEYLHEVHFIQNVSSINSTM